VYFFSCRVPAYRKLAEDELRRMIAEQEEVILSRLENAFGPKAVASADPILKLDDVLRAVALDIEHLISVWRDVLPQREVLLPIVVRLFDFSMAKIVRTISGFAFINRSRVRSLRRFLLEFKAKALLCAQTALSENRGDKKTPTKIQEGASALELSSLFTALEMFMQVCSLLEPHVSLSILSGMVNDGSLSSVDARHKVALARALFGKSASESELDEFGKIAALKKS